jgi:hypothetical protein
VCGREGVDRTQKNNSVKRSSMNETSLFDSFIMGRSGSSALPDCGGFEVA